MPSPVEIDILSIAISVALSKSMLGCEVSLAVSLLVGFGLLLPPNMNERVQESGCKFTKHKIFKIASLFTGYLKHIDKEFKKTKAASGVCKAPNTPTKE